MPRVSSTRRSAASGSINTSRGSRSQAPVASSSRRRIDEDEEEGEAAKAGNETEEPQSNAQQGEEDDEEAHPAERIRTALEAWETRHHPFAGRESAVVTQTLLQDASSVQDGIATVLAILSDCAERRAELDFVDDEAGMRHDDILQSLDEDTRELLDLRSRYNLRQSVLKEMHSNVIQGEEYTQASKDLVEQSKVLLDIYAAKTPRQRYRAEEDYESFRTKIWQAISVDAMPPLTDFIAAVPGDEAGAGGAGDGEDDEESDLEIRGAIRSFKCPLSLRIMEDPVRSTVCAHAYERKAIHDFLASNTGGRTTHVVCPASSCSAKISMRTLAEDPELRRQAKAFARRQEARTQKRKDTQAPPAMLD